MLNIKSKFSSLFTQLSSMLSPADTDEQTINKLESTQKIIEEVQKQFSNPDLTTFICVCIPEFLSLYETERLIQELAKLKIDTDNIIVNQILYPSTESHCHLCSTRSQMQQKYLRQIGDLYEDFHITKLPLLDHEVRGVEQLSQFSKCLLTSYKPPQ